MQFYKATIKEIIKYLNSSKEGLKKKDVEERIKNFGRNIIQIKKETSFLKLLLLQFKNYLVWLLIFVAIIAFFTGFYFKREEQIIDGIIITLIILLNAFISAYQDYKSEKAAELLKRMVKTETIVLRNGRREKILSEELVPGDIIFLSEGDKVPADCRILESESLRVDESILTGESKTVNKKNVIIKKEVPIAERKNMVYMNTFVVGGRAKCIVVKTGKNTEVGKIAESLNIKQESLFLKEVDEASKKITYVALGLIIISLIIYYFHSHNLISLFLLGSALIIGSIPEGLPAIVTFSLSMSALNLSKKNVLVKRKTVLETLGSVDVICTDKTGTLTENKMKVKKVYLNNKIINFNSKNKIYKKTLAYEELKNSGLFCNEAKNTDKGFLGNAEDIALIDYFNFEGIDIIKLKEKGKIIFFEPFSSEKKYSLSKIKFGKKTTIYTKGAPEIILEKCNKQIVGNKIKVLEEKDKKRIKKILKKFSEESLRNIAFSYNDVFIGLIGLYDPPKKNIKKTIRGIYNAGIDIKMITGDNINTARAIAKECGFRRIKAINWDELKDLSEKELKKTVKEYNVFSRMSPEFKLKIVKALQEEGRRVGITGDGVNDVPALKEAHVGIAMGKKGSDIAKEAADLIILDDNLSSIVEGIKEGRTIFSNIRKVINYLLTANLAEVLVVFITSIKGFVPFLAIQLLWVNFVTDIAPAMALGTDPPHKNIMRKKPTGKNENLINKRIVWLTIGISIKKVIILLLIFFLTLKFSKSLIVAQTATFTWLVFSHFVRVAAIRFDEKVNLFINKYVNWAIIIPILLQLLIIYTPISKFFKVVPLTIKEWIVLIITILIAVFLAKIITMIIDKNIPLSEKDY